MLLNSFNYNINEILIYLINIKYYINMQYNIYGDWYGSAKFGKCPLTVPKKKNGPVTSGTCNSNLCQPGSCTGLGTQKE